MAHEKENLPDLCSFLFGRTLMLSKLFDLCSASDKSNMANQLFVLDTLPVVNVSLPIMNVDLSTFTSDGTGYYPPS